MVLPSADRHSGQRIMAAANGQLWVNLIVETGHFPAWPLIEIRRPCKSSSQTFSTVPASPLARTTALPRSSDCASPNAFMIVDARSVTDGISVPDIKTDGEAVFTLNGALVVTRLRKSSGTFDLKKVLRKLSTGPRSKPSCPSRIRRIRQR